MWSVIVHAYSTCLELLEQLCTCKRYEWRKHSVQAGLIFSAVETGRYYKCLKAPGVISDHNSFLYVNFNREKVDAKKI